MLEDSILASVNVSVTVEVLNGESSVDGGKAFLSVGHCVEDGEETAEGSKGDNIVLEVTLQGIVVSAVLECENLSTNRDGLEYQHSEESSDQMVFNIFSDTGAIDINIAWIGLLCSLILLIIIVFIHKTNEFISCRTNGVSADHSSHTGYHAEDENFDGFDVEKWSLSTSAIGFSLSDSGISGFPDLRSTDQSNDYCNESPELLLGEDGNFIVAQVVGCS